MPLNPIAKQNDRINALVLLFASSAALLPTCSDRIVYVDATPNGKTNLSLRVSIPYSAPEGLALGRESISRERTESPVSVFTPRALHRSGRSCVLTGLRCESYGIFSRFLLIGVGGHMAPHFIPTVERESIDLAELLYIGGILCRAVYELELSEIQDSWKEVAAITELLADSFYGCSTLPSRLLSSVGVRGAPHFREFDSVLAKFLKSVPMLSEYVTQYGARSIAALPDKHNFTRSVDLAKRVLSTLSRVWLQLPEDIRRESRNAFRNKPCIPTSKGLCCPECSCLPIWRDVSCPLEFRKILPSIFFWIKCGRGGNWTMLDLIKHLIQEERSLTDDDISGLKLTKIFTKEDSQGGSDSEENVGYCADELFPPVDTFWKLQLPVIEWSGKLEWRETSSEAQLLYRLGVATSLCRLLFGNEQDECHAAPREVDQVRSTETESSTPRRCAEALKPSQSPSDLHDDGVLVKK
ncbi:hypothetical protein EV363DRAFT_1133107, partial [Boletus edulis]